ncbi:MAG: precorrin-8X/cobalt-precorrin-8 methylmutase [Acidimicrobiaceae bacterium]|jgi:precorrin-8X/cobalt-precorrin-8 methylmutase|nr:precorrin-8X/cobalt-precorrin-8 methylmutase [Acidimicrobiaceae bacterium]
MNIHPIEAESYRIMESRVDLSRWSRGAREVVARIIHASADVDYATSTVVGSHAVVHGIEALRAGAPVVTDVEMVRAGLSGVAAECFLAEVEGSTGELTRSAVAMRLAAERHPAGAVFVIGCAPTALFEVVRLADEGVLHPAVVVGMPVGFVGAAESKQALRDSRLAHISISNVGEKGGSAVAAAALNALARFARG